MARGPPSVTGFAAVSNLDLQLRTRCHGYGLRNNEKASSAVLCSKWRLMFLLHIAVVGFFRFSVPHISWDGTPFGGHTLRLLQSTVPTLEHFIFNEMILDGYR